MRNLSSKGDLVPMAFTASFFSRAKLHAPVTFFQSVRTSSIKMTLEKRLKMRYPLS